MSQFQGPTNENDSRKERDYLNSDTKRMKKTESEFVFLQSKIHEDVSKRKERKKRLPVHVVEQHNDVLPFIHRAIGSRKLPFSEIPFIHFDSHPDLLIPIHLDADVVQKPSQLYEGISIENWLLPLTYAKHVDHVVWIKPPWAYQIPPSHQSFTIGKCQESGKLRLNCKENYFLTDGLFRPSSLLVNSSEVNLSVLELQPKNWSDLDPCYKQIHKPEGSKGKRAHPDFQSYESWTGFLESIVKDKPYILDVDLDFFSTRNPFKGIYSHEEEELLKRLYKCPPLSGMSDEEVLKFTSRRQEQLCYLEKVFSNANVVWSDRTDIVPENELRKMTLSKIVGSTEELIKRFSSEERDDIMRVCQSVLLSDRKSRGITFNQLHDFGCTLDETELPDHVSSDKQVTALEEAMEHVLKMLPRPTLVTISRSSHDDYCPPDKVESYQNMFLNLLERVFGDMDVTEDY